MDIREICAEKLRAMSDRARYRDFYDLSLLLETYPLDLKEVIGFIRQKEIRRPITKANMRANWKIIGTQKETEMRQIYYSRAVSDAQIEPMIQSLPLKNIS